MWLATDQGICRYDGFEFKSYSNPSQTSKAGSQIKEDRFGRIWYENFDGFLYYIQNDKLHRLEEQTVVGFNDYCITSNNIIVISKKGIDIYALGDLKIKNTISVDNKYTGKAVDVGSGLLIHKAPDGLIVDDKGKVKLLESNSCFNYYSKYAANISVKIGESIYCINGISEQSICYKYANDKLVDCFEIDKEYQVQSAFTADNHIWMCTSKGVLCYDTNGVFVNKNEKWLSNLNINCGFQSRDKTYWLGTAGKGLLILRDIETRMFLSGSAISKLELQDSVLLVGTRNDEVFNFSPYSNKLNLLHSSKSNHSIDFLMYSGLDKTIYFADDYFNEYELSSKKLSQCHFAVKDMELLDSSYVAIAASGVVSLLKTNINSKGSPYDSIYNASPQNQMNTRDVLSLVRAKSIARFKNGLAFYTAGNMGLYQINPRGAKEVLNKDKRMFFSKIESGGDIIVALGTNGLLWTMNKQHQFLPIDSTGSVRNIFLCDTLLCVDYGAALRFFSIQKSGVVSLGKSYPISDRVYDVKLLNNALYIATFNGLLRIKLGDINKKTSPPSFYINSVKIKDKLLDNLKNIELSFDENDLEISYSLLDFKKLDQHQLTYNINNGEWKELPDNSRTLRLAALAGGNYEIRFRVDGEEENDATLRFSIRVQWWKQAWFIIACFILAISLIVIYYRWQTSLLNKRNQLLVQKIELEKNLNQSVLTSIKAQMNPHFFYNALNTIQSYIFTDDKKNATNYLSKFSKLTRIILEMSGKETVSLKEEISALQLYLELEKVRFSGDFEYVLDTKNIDAEMIRIPSMIIQPFVENAIKHGLLHKKGQKDLRIGFEMKEGILQVIIDDNGIGRKKAGELNKIKEVKHDSFSTSANAKRLEILNEGRSNKVGFNIDDKYDGNGNAIGTTVTIQIPI